jgi:hypothetical protein
MRFLDVNRIIIGYEWYLPQITREFNLLARGAESMEPFFHWLVIFLLEYLRIKSFFYWPAIFIPKYLRICTSQILAPNLRIYISGSSKIYIVKLSACFLELNHTFCTLSVAWSFNRNLRYQFGIKCIKFHTVINQHRNN